MNKGANYLKIFTSIFSLFIALNIYLIASHILIESNAEVLDKFISKKLTNYIPDSSKSQSIPITFEVIIPDTNTNYDFLEKLNKNLIKDSLSVMINPSTTLDSIALAKMMIDFDFAAITIGNTNFLVTKNSRAYILETSIPTGHMYNINTMGWPHAIGQSLNLNNLQLSIKAVELGDDKVSLNLFTSSDNKIFDTGILPKTYLRPFDETNSYKPTKGSTYFFDDNHHWIFSLIAIASMVTSYFSVVRIIRIADFLSALKILNLTSMGISLTPVAINTDMFSVSISAYESDAMTIVSVICFFSLIVGFVLYMVAKYYDATQQERELANLAAANQSQWYRSSLLFTCLGCSSIIFYFLEVLYQMTS